MKQAAKRQLTAPHVVYAHYNADRELIYVGCTSDMKRPTQSRGREWVKTETARVETSPEMSYAAAAWMEDMMIRTLSPKHNKASGHRIDSDPRIGRIVREAGVTYGRARAAYQNWGNPDDETFEKYLRNYASHVKVIDAGPPEGYDSDGEFVTSPEDVERINRAMDGMFAAIAASRS